MPEPEGGFGLGTMAHWVPLQCSVKVPPGPTPTAQTSLAETAATPSSRLSPVPTFGLETNCQGPQLNAELVEDIDGLAGSRPIVLAARTIFGAASAARLALKRTRREHTPITLKREEGCIENPHFQKGLFLSDF